MEGKYDSKLEACDWRDSAAIVGLIKFLKFHDIEYSEERDFILYNQEDITEERFQQFVEYVCEDDMWHRKAEEKLRGSEFSQEEIDEINKNLVGNTIMKNIFGKVKFDGTNKEEIVQLINENRLQIVMETFRNKSNLYKNFCNTNLLGKEEQPHCRLVGYNIDENRKSKSVSYAFEKNIFVSKDRKEYDFIPFAFTNTYEAFFINNNSSVENLRKTNRTLQDKVKEQLENKELGNARTALFAEIIENAKYIDYDVEVIVKSRDKEYFETLFIRKKAISILKDIKNLKSISLPYKVAENYNVDIQKEIINAILNDLKLDWLIYLLLKDREKNYNYVISRLIEINQRIKEEDVMTQGMKVAWGCAKECTRILENEGKGNKIKSYKDKLISAIVAEDYDRVNDILLQLSNYSNVAFPFAYDLFEDFEHNKEVALTFIHTLGDDTEGNNSETKKGEN